MIIAWDILGCKNGLHEHENYENKKSFQWDTYLLLEIEYWYIREFLIFRLSFLMQKKGIWFALFIIIIIMMNFNNFKAFYHRIFTTTKKVFLKHFLSIHLIKIQKHLLIAYLGEEDSSKVIVGSIFYYNG